MAAAEHSEKRLTQMRGRLIAAETTIERLDESLRKAWGTVSRMRRDDRPRTLDVEEMIGAAGVAPPQIVNGGMDPELAAELALQNAPAPAPGR